MHFDKLFLDSDGVVFDFDRHFESFSGVNPKNMKDPDMWALINTVPDFWLTMPMLEGAPALVEGLAGYTKVVLSGCPKSGFHLAADHKRQKFAKNFPGLPVLTGPSKYKPITASVHLGILAASLVDDMEDVFLGRLSVEHHAEKVVELKAVLANLDLGGALLVDDNVRNCKMWTKCNGRAILFRNTPQALSDHGNNKFFELRK